jgi:transaldolase/glucose-6-phosphate isomerase
MGGSSLAPEVLSLSFSYRQREKMKFAILDSTDPVQVRECERRFPVDQTLVIVSSKSGGTAEVSALLDFFWERSGHDGSRFIAITDPGTSLEALANTRGFRRTFLADPSVGGRYSALTAFGLVPAGLIGIDLERLLERAEWMARQCSGSQPAVRNPGLVLGAILGQAALAGRDKVTLIADPGIASFSSWLEQLLAESSGKQGKGFVPIADEPLGVPERYGQDRLFFYLRQTGRYDHQVKALQDASQPVIVFHLPESSELGAEFYRWEMATAVGCSILGVNAFDQPDVQDSKDRTKAKLFAYAGTGRLEEPPPAWKKNGYQLFAPGPLTGVSLRQVVVSFLETARTGDYVAINAYLPRDARRSTALQELRAAVLERTGCATTVGFGPRFQHSTGQLHKGGPNRGVFLEITVEHRRDIVIPNQGLSFAVLERAQALGDYEALLARQRRLLRIHLPTLRALPQLVQAMQTGRLAARGRRSSGSSAAVRRRRVSKKR